MFDAEIRATWLGQINGPICGSDIGTTPIVSILTPGVGVAFNKRDCGMFRFGVRPEFVLCPHCDDENNNNDWGWGSDHQHHDSSGGGRVGIKQWVVPELLAEYCKCYWAVGVAYKRYDLRGCGILGGNFDIADLNTITLYGKYKGLLIGVSLLSGSKGNNTPVRFDNRAALTVGYGYPF